MFERGNVCVFGIRGSGKDVLFGNVIARRKKPYISNVPYGYEHIPYNYSDIDLANNCFKDFVKGSLKHYEWRYQGGEDIYLSDTGVYFPSQYCGELNKLYPSLPLYFALSRQVSHNNVHVNAQHLGRIWDKIREQSDTYIMCLFCKIFLGIAILRIRVYDKYDSALNRIKPFKMTLPRKRTPESDMMYQLHKDKFENSYGKIREYWLIFRNLSKHDTYYFKTLLKGDNIEENTCSCRDTRSSDNDDFDSIC